MWIDLSHGIESGMTVYPGDASTDLVQTAVLDRDGFVNHQLNVNMHAGTHIDGPMHLTESREFISGFPVDRFAGHACLLDVSGERVVEVKEEYEHRIYNGSIVVLYTGWSKWYGEPQYYSEHPVLSRKFAELLVNKQVKMVGFDMPSPDREPYEIHKLLLGNGLLLLENLTNVEKLLGVGEFEIVAVPLKVKADSALVRAVARVGE